MDWGVREELIDEANINRLEMSKTKNKICYSSSDKDESLFSTSLISERIAK